MIKVMTNLFQPVRFASSVRPIDVEKAVVTDLQVISSICLKRLTC